MYNPAEYTQAQSGDGNPLLPLVDGVKDLFLKAGEYRLMELFPEQYAAPPETERRDPSVDLELAKATATKEKVVYGLAAAALLIGGVIVVKQLMD